MKREWEMLGPRFPRLPVRDEDASLRGDGAHEQTAHARGCPAPAAPRVLGWEVGWLWSAWWEGIDPGGLWASVSPVGKEEYAWILHGGSQFSKNGNLLEKFANEVRELGMGDRRIQLGTPCGFDLQLKTSQWMAPSRFHNIQASRHADWDLQGLGHPPL